MKGKIPDCPLHELPMQPVPREGSREVFRCPNPNCSIEIDRAKPETRDP